MHRLASPLVLLALVLLLLPGCIKVKQTLKLNKDFSGEVDLEYTLDFESFARATVEIQKTMTGDETPVTEAEVAEALATLKAEMDADMKSEEGEDQRPFPELKELPEGMKIVKEELRMEETGMVGQVTLSFDHVSRLTDLRAKLDAQEGEDDQLASMLGAFDVQTKGKTVTISGVPFETLYDPSLDEETRAEVMEMLTDMSFVFEIETDMKVKMSDADKRKGLVWTWGAARMLQPESPAFKAILKK